MRAALTPTRVPTTIAPMITVTNSTRSRWRWPTSWLVVVALGLFVACGDPSAASDGEDDVEDSGLDTDALSTRDFGGADNDAPTPDANPSLDVGTPEDTEDSGGADATDAADVADPDGSGESDGGTDAAVDSDVATDVPPCEGDDCPCVDNECGGCRPLEGEPDDPCGTCGSGTWACNGPEEVICFGDVGDRARNVCGGCAELEGELGDACGVCGMLACDDLLTLSCDDPVPCGSCGDGEVGIDEACDDGNTESCDGCELCEVHQSLSLADGGSAVTIAHPEYDVTSFTLEFWMWIPPVLEAGDNTLIFAQDAGLDEPGWLTFQLGEHSRGEIHYAYAGSWGPIPGTFFVDDDGPGRWVHIAITEGEAIGRVWINGSLAAQTVPHEDVEPISGQPLYIGALPHVPRYRRFAGLMDEFRISSTPRYFATFEPPRRLLADGATVAMWRFDDVDGDVVEDLSGNGYDLRLEPGAVLVPDDGFGLFCD